MGYEQLKIENSSFFILHSSFAHGSKPVAHSTKENYEKDITSHIRIVVRDVFDSAE